MLEAATIDERDLLTAAREGDRAAFGALVKAYQRRAYAIAYGFVGNREDALELAQDAFARAYQAMPRFDTSMPFYPWLYRIIKNSSLNFLKKRKRRGESSLDSMMESGFDAIDAQRTPDAQVELDDVQFAVRAALTKLSPEQREIIRLRHFLEMSYGEIAEALAIPQGTVMSRLHGARKRLKSIIEESAPSVNV
ncbi:MAG: sigma-70 family RNA polymerase sigma factor [Candidatus Hydrogenedentes bacterium]|nr:sigma-70 family RNA polymerase sigma factor [Candidatus Hydrogenedentota bacterium]